DTCAWQSHGYLALPNTSLVDGESFTVTGTLSVDFSTPATSAAPPAPATQYGTPIDASTFTTVPTMSVYGPDLIHVSPADGVVSLVVESAGQGSLTASLGGTPLGTAAVSPGANALKFKLPASLLASLRHSSGAMVLTLIPAAPDGLSQGSPLTRKVSLTPAAKKPVVKKKTVAK